MVFSQTDGFRLRTNTDAVSFVTVSPSEVVKKLALRLACWRTVEIHDRLDETKD